MGRAVSERGLTADLRHDFARRWQQLPVFWRVQIVGWGLFSLVDLATRTVVYQSFTTALTITLLLEPLLVLAAAGLRAAFLHLGLNGRLSVAALACIFALSGGTAILIVSVLTLVRGPLGWGIPDWNASQELLAPLAYYMLIFGGWSLAYFWVRAEIEGRAERQRAATAEAEALRAELQQLRLQLNPHFLFNALNGVAEEIPEHPDAALAMVRDLAAYLRHTLAGINQSVVSVAAEAEALGAYLRIQEARFGPRLRSRVEVDPAAAGRPIASVLLQPLVENAVEHGDREGHIDLTVRITAEGEALRVVIENSGALAPQDGPAPPRHTGIGLENVRRRLALHYPGRHRFELRQQAVVPRAADCHHHDAVVAELLLEGEPCSVS
ncbi:sensor histidine kinase [Azorhizobium doebereinerae]|uniref:sensor histidine kinase n=1 Tax=Azorhizobium doebereinerae TaxID=281091 RepID=UPI00041E59F3|nr:histidine kinase [Azorhizobium doebereinerae]